MRCLARLIVQRRQLDELGAISGLYIRCGPLAHTDEATTRRLQLIIFTACTLVDASRLKEPLQNQVLHGISPRQLVQLDPASLIRPRYERVECCKARRRQLLDRIRRALSRRASMTLYHAIGVDRFDRPEAWHDGIAAMLHVVRPRRRGPGSRYLAGRCGSYAAHIGQGVFGAIGVRV